MIRRGAPSPAPVLGSLAVPNPPRSLDLPTIAARLRGLPPRPREAAEGARASVAAILREGPERRAELLLIRRAEHPRDPWSGHMAFPGGRRDEGDRDLLHTAVREGREEVARIVGAYRKLLEGALGPPELWRLLKTEGGYGVVRGSLRVLPS